MLGTLATRRFRPALLLVLVVGFVVALQVTPAFGAALVVNTTADNTTSGDGFCTLREAVSNANLDGGVGTTADCVTGAGADSITFTATGTITLTLGQLVVLDQNPDTLTITGGGSVTISASGSRAFLVGNDSVDDALARSLILNTIIVRDGNGTGLSGANQSTNGGCILVRPNGLLDMNTATVRNCTSVANGGGIYGDEDTTITVNSASLIDSNTADANGGGIFMTTGNIVVDGDSCIQNNVSSAVGGGIGTGDTVTIVAGGGSVSNRAFFIANQANSGGAIYMDVNSTLNGNHARFFGNIAFDGGAFFSQGGSGANGENAIGRRCVNCCIVGNSDNAVRQIIDGLNANFVGNWWGNDFGPYISVAGTNTASGTSTGDRINGNGISPINVGIVNTPADYGSESSGGDSNWLRLADNDVPSDCITDTCGPTSGLPANRASRVCTYTK